MNKQQKVELLTKVLTPEVCDAIDLSLDLCGPLETWIEEDLDAVIARLKEENYL